jgi:hypothetical protein
VPIAMCFKRQKEAAGWQEPELHLLVAAGGAATASAPHPSAHVSKTLQVFSIDRITVHIARSGKRPFRAAWRF